MYPVSEKGTEKHWVSIRKLPKQKDGNTREINWSKYEPLGMDRNSTIGSPWQNPYPRMDSTH